MPPTIKSPNELYTAGQKRANNLKDIVRQATPIALFCGAGVSIGYGLPQWEPLIERLFSRAFQKLLGNNVEPITISQIANLYSHLNTGSPLVTARQVRQLIGDEFTDAVRTCLYEGAKGNQHDDPIVQIISTAIAQHQLQGLNEIVTYNYDDYIEYSLRERRRLKVRAISHKEHFSKLVGNENITIYYVHGRIPHQAGDESSSEIILTEDSYHWLQERPLAWQNRVQLDLLSRKTVLMLGISLTDPNVRRLLELNYIETKRNHFLIRKLETSKEMKQKTRKLVLPRGQESILINHLAHISLHIEELVAAELGVKIIYVREWVELPSLLQHIFDLPAV